MSSPHVTCDISTARGRCLGPRTVKPSLTLAGGKDSFNLGLGLGRGQRFPDPREWMVLLHGSRWSLEWTAGVKSLTDPLSLTLLDSLPSFWPPKMFSTWGVLPSPVSGLGASWKPLDLQGRLIPSQALLRARFRGEIPGSGVCATQDRTQLYPHEEERWGMCRKGHFLPFLPDPHSLVVHTLM